VRFFQSPREDSKKKSPAKQPEKTEVEYSQQKLEQPQQTEQLAEESSEQNGRQLEQTSEESGCALTTLGSPRRRRHRRRRRPNNDDDADHDNTDSVECWPPPTSRHGVERLSLSPRDTDDVSEAVTEPSGFGACESGLPYTKICCASDGEYSRHDGDALGVDHCGGELAHSCQPGGSASLTPRATLPPLHNNGL